MVGCLIGGYLVVLLLVNYTPAQRALADWVERLAQRSLCSQVSIDRLEVGLFNRVTLHGVTLLDQQGDTLLAAGRLSAKVELRSLLRRHLVLRSVSLLDARIQLYRERADGPANYQFLVDAFRSSEPRPDAESWDFSVGALIVRRCAVSYDERFRPRRPAGLDLAHLRVTDLNSSLSLRSLTADSLDVRVRSLALRERSGLDVRAMTFRFVANERQARLARFEVALPATRLTHDELLATYDATSRQRLLETLQLSGRLRVHALSSRDVAPLLPLLGEADASFSGEVDYALRHRQLSLARLSLAERSGRYRLEANGRLSFDSRGVRAGSVRLVDLSVRDTTLVATAAKALGRQLPPALSGLVPLHVEGGGSYQRSGRSHVRLSIATGAGALQLDAEGRGEVIAGRISSPEFSLAALLPGDSVPTGVAFNATASLALSDGRVARADAQLQVDHLRYRGVDYRQLQADAAWDGRRVTAQLASANPGFDLTLAAAGHYDGQRLSGAEVQAHIAQLSPSQLGLTQRYGQTLIQGDVRTHWDASPDAGLRAAVLVDRFAMLGADGAELYRLDSLRLALTPCPAGSRVTLASDFAHGRLEGPLSLSAMRSGLAAVARRVLPPPPGAPASPPAASPAASQWRFQATLRRADFLRHVLQVPLTLTGPLRMEGRVPTDGSRLSLTASAPALGYGNFALRDVRLYMDGLGSRLSLLCQGERQVGKADLQLVLRAEADSGVLHTHLQWDDQSTHRYAGQLHATTAHGGAPGAEQVVTRIQPTTITVADTMWRVASGRFVWSREGLAVDSFRLARAGRWLAVDGKFSPRPSDSIVARLHRMDISYLIGMAGSIPVAFSGEATGRIALAPSESGDITAAAQLHIPQLRFNDGLMGRTALRATFSSADGRLHLDADMREDSIGGQTRVTGYVGISEKDLDLHVGSRHTNLQFLGRYVGGILGDIQGRTSGFCHIYGPFKQLDFEGQESPTLSAEVLATGVRYALSNGTCTMRPGEFRFVGFDLADASGGTGAFSGTMRHEHIKNIRYDFAVEARQLHVYDRPRTPDMPFYATVFGTGHARLRGQPGTLTCDLALRPTRRTFLTYYVDAPELTSESGLLTLRPATPPDSPAPTAQPPEPSAEAPSESRTTATNIFLNFDIDMNPDATLRVFTDEKAGDYILLSGAGPLRATYYNKGAFQMFGTLTVSHGTYRLNIQNALRKNFTLRPGSTLTFAGDPYDGDLDLRAVYTVPSASLSDLGLGTNFSDNSVRADCVMQLGGKVRAPQVSFDLELPDVSAEVSAMVRQMIATEEDLNMQIIYLLGVGRFYTYNYASSSSAASGQSQSSVAMKSLLSSTLSSQLNDIIADAVGRSNWTFGTNLATGQLGWSDMEVAGLLTGRLLNNRLILNGNFGYRDRPTSSSNFVGDFDLQYLLTPSGSVSLKAYSETNDRYFTRTSLTTQGIGIRLSRDFRTLRELFSSDARRERRKRETEEPIRNRPSIYSKKESQD